MRLRTKKGKERDGEIAPVVFPRVLAPPSVECELLLLSAD